MAGAIVVGVEASDASKMALRWAVDEARLRGATLTVVHAFPALQGYGGGVAPDYYPQLEREAEEEFRSILAEVPEVDGLENVEKKVVAGGAAEKLVEESKEADLLVVGSRGRGGFRGLLLGSVSQQCVHYAHCPVVVIRAAHKED